MSKRSEIIVTGVLDITGAVEFAEAQLAAGTQDPGVSVCLLVCEELLLKLLHQGHTGIRVSAKGGRSGYVEISAPKTASDQSPASSGTDHETVNAQINECLLEQYADHYAEFYLKNRVLYRVYTKKRFSFDLTEEIYSFYQNAGPEEQQKPASVLLHIARNHSAFIGVSVFILLLRHLAALMLPVFVANIINIVTETGSFFNRSVAANILASLSAIIVNLFCYYLDSRFYRGFARAVEAGFRMALVRKLQTLSMQFHNNAQSGKLLSKLIQDVQFVEMLIYDRFLDVLLLSEDIVFIIVVALLKFPLMLVFYLLIAPVVVFLIRRFSGPLLESRAGMRKEMEQTNSAIKEMLEMEPLFRSHGLDKTEYRSILSRVRRVQRASVSYDRKTVSVNNVTYGGFQGLRLLSLSFAAYLTATGRIDVGTLVLFQSVFDLIINNIQKILDAVPLITQGYDSLFSVNELLYSRDIEQNGTKLLPTPVRGGIEFRNVSFCYEETTGSILRDVSFKVPAGRSVAFVGESGQGKTTILNLILGLYCAKSGEILIDGINIDQLEKSAYRRYVAVVPQNTTLFSGTLWDNLVCGLSYVTAGEVMEVIRQTKLEDLLDSLENGLNTRILENGSNLSGGERQRISIARALLRKPKIILLDEATSALDSETEKQVQTAIEAIMGSCTVVMVAHRINTLRCADTIYRLDQGKVRRYDSFEQLMQDAPLKELS